MFGDQRDPGVIARKMVPNEEYDALLSSSVVLCLMYATAANNVVVECIARGTPLLINPLPAVVEYLGPDYPLYAADEVAADRLLGDPARIRAAQRRLLPPPNGDRPDIRRLLPRYSCVGILCEVVIIAS